MKKHYLLTLVVCLASLLPAFAQMNQGLGIKVTLPYTVMVGQSSLPAGAYSIQTVRDDGNSGILIIRSESTGAAIEVLASHVGDLNGHAAAKTEVTLKAVDGKFQLDKIWVEGQAFGYELNSAH